MMEEFGYGLLTAIAIMVFVFAMISGINVLHGGESAWAYVQPENGSYCAYLHNRMTPDTRLSCNLSAKDASETADGINRELAKWRKP